MHLRPFGMKFRLRKLLFEFQIQENLLNYQMERHTYAFSSTLSL